MEIGRRKFLLELGVLSGTAFAWGALEPVWVHASGATLRYGINSRDIRRLDPMAGPNSNDKTVLAAIFNGLVRPAPGEVDAEHLEPDLARAGNLRKISKPGRFDCAKASSFTKGTASLRPTTSFSP